MVEEIDLTRVTRFKFVELVKIGLNTFRKIEAAIVFAALPSKSVFPLSNTQNSSHLFDFSIANFE